MREAVERPARLLSSFARARHLPSRRLSAFPGRGRGGHATLPTPPPPGQAIGSTQPAPSGQEPHEAAPAVSSGAALGQGLGYGGRGRGGDGASPYAYGRGIGRIPAEPPSQESPPVDQAPPGFAGVGAAVGRAFSGFSVSPGRGRGGYGAPPPEPGLGIGRTLTEPPLQDPLLPLDQAAPAVSSGAAIGRDVAYGAGGPSPPFPYGRGIGRIQAEPSSQEYPPVNQAAPAVSSVAAVGRGLGYAPRGRGSDRTSPFAYGRGVGRTQFEPPVDQAPPALEAEPPSQEYPPVDQAPPGFAGDGADVGRGQAHKDDYYRETFRPVIQRDLQHAFAPEGLMVGPGVGRGRPIPSMPMSSSDLGAAVSPTEDREADEHYSTLSLDEKGDRAFRILEEQYKRTSRRTEEWFKARDTDSRYRTRSPVEMQQVRGREDLRESRPKLQRTKKQTDVKGKEEGRRDEEQLTENDKVKRKERRKREEYSEEMELFDSMFHNVLKNMAAIELEPEYAMGVFMSPPNLEEVSPPPLEEVLKKVKPYIAKAGFVNNEEEWQALVEDTLEAAPLIEKFVEQQSGPGRYTAKQENEDLEVIAETLPSDVGPNMQAFTQRALDTLKSNPGFNLDEKQWMLTAIVREFSQYQYV